MFAFFHMSGTMPSVRDRLNIIVITDEKFLQNQQGISSEPTAVFCRLSKNFRTISVDKDGVFVSSGISQRSGGL